MTSLSEDLPGRARSYGWPVAHLEALVLAAAALALSTAPFLPAILGLSDAHIYNALAADAFYYLRMAENALETGVIGFDGETASNGYMPLWQMIVLSLAWVSGSLAHDPTYLVTLLFSLSLVLFSLANVVIGIFFLRIGGILGALIALFLIVPGIFFWIFEPPWRVDLGRPGITYGYTSWSIVNGMESSLGYLLFAVTLQQLLKLAGKPEQPQIYFLRLGLLCALIFLTRLDDVFFGISVGALLLLLGGRNWARRTALVGIFPVILGLIYLSLNHFLVGSALPTSGLAKTALLQFPIDINGLRASHTFRLVPLLAFFTTGLIALFFLWRNRLLHTTAGRIVFVLAVYLLLKSFFLLSSVRLLSQGYWYYSVSIASVGVIVAVPLLYWQRPVAAAVKVAALAVFSLATANVLASTEYRLSKLDPSQHAFVAHYLCHNSDALRDAIITLAAESGVKPRLIDTFDGMYSYCLRLPAMDYTGLGSSPEVLQARSTLGFFRAAFERNYRLIADSTVESARYEYDRKMAAQGMMKVPLLSEGPIVIWLLQRGDATGDSNELVD